MAVVFMPNVGDTFTLDNVWAPMLDWDNRNLVLLKNLKLTGTRKVSLGYDFEYDVVKQEHIKDSNGNYVRTERVINRTVPNPLFVDDNGDTVPVMITFPKDTVFEISKYLTGWNNAIESVWLKVISCPDNRFTKRCVSVIVKEFNGAEITVK